MPPRCGAVLPSVLPVPETGHIGHQDAIGAFDRGHSHTSSTRCDRQKIAPQEQSFAMTIAVVHFAPGGRALQGAQELRMEVENWHGSPLS